MPTASGAPLGNRLAAVANKHKKVSQANSLRAMLNAARSRGNLRSANNVAPVYQNYFSPPKENKTKKCGPKPLAWIGTQKNPAFEEWKKCAEPVMPGGKRRKTARRSKKSRRLTRKRR